LQKCDTRFYNISAAADDEMDDAAYYKQEVGEEPAPGTMSLVELRVGARYLVVWHPLLL
jgi:hypothetical protein